MYTLLIYIEMSLFKNILFDVNININHSYGGDKMNDEIEIWKDVKGYEGLYKVSNKGRVYSFITNRYMIPQ